MGSVGRLVRIGVLSGSALAGAAAAALAVPPAASATDAHFAAATAATALVRALTDGETAHRLAVWAAAHGWTPVDGRPDPPSLRTTVWGRRFRNPLGLAAGFDKDADAIDGMLGLGFGFVEIGSVTPLPQPGNPKPRVFRLPASRAIVNRYGFNSAGKDAALVKVSAWRSDHPRALTAPTPTPATAPPPAGLLGVNLGKNKDQPDAAADYAAGARAFAPLADFLVVNVSSPNTPGLRALQSRGALTALLTAAVKARDEACAEAAGGVEADKGGWWAWARGGGGRKNSAPRPLAHTPPLLVKIDADADDAAAADVAAAALAAGVDGVIVSNTTVSRPASVARDPRDAAAAAQAGGLSGPPLRPLATAAVARMYRLLKGRLPIVGVGGVSDGASAYEKIKAGASLVELYTALAYDGPALVPRVKAELAALLARDGYGSVEDAVGVEADKW